VNKENKINPLQFVHENLEKLDKLQKDDKFSFSCHQGIDCWGVCCKTTNVYLTPYDTLRLKTNLGIDSSKFLAKHTIQYMGEDFGLPLVKLKMEDNGHCPFLCETGCTVYKDRPTSCRTYPIGQATSSGSHNVKGEMAFFKVKEAHCHGWQEAKEWSLEEWFADQGVLEYNSANEFSVFLSFNPNLGEVGKLDEKKLGMILMALYDVDQFRKFVLESSFLDKFTVTDEEIEKFKVDDNEALKLGMKWVHFSILGAPVFELK
tara:strand:+ start:28275 stop:29057 length:783 start_codon:yes stop_codon:yes gene_type:complete